MNTRDELRRSAAEYVLGTMDATERAAMRDWMAADPDVAALVRMWEHRLSPLLELSAPARLPSTMLDDILSKLPLNLPVKTPVAPAPVEAPPAALAEGATSGEGEATPVEEAPEVPAPAPPEPAEPVAAGGEGGDAPGPATDAEAPSEAIAVQDEAGVSPETASAPAEGEPSPAPLSDTPSSDAPRSDASSPDTSSPEGEGPGRSPTETDAGPAAPVSSADAPVSAETPLADAPAAAEATAGADAPPVPDAPPVSDPPVAEDAPASNVAADAPPPPDADAAPATLAAAPLPVATPSMGPSEAPPAARETGSGWRRLSGVLMLVLLAGAGTVAYRELHPPPPPPPPPPTIVRVEAPPPPAPPPEEIADAFAVLGPQPVPAIGLTLDVDTGTVKVLKLPSPPGEGMRYDLWLVADQDGPRRLASFRETGDVQSDAVRMLDRSRLADTFLIITREPEAEAGALPSGTPIYSGMAVAR